MNVFKHVHATLCMHFAERDHMGRGERPQHPDKYIECAFKRDGWEERDNVGGKLAASELYVHGEGLDAAHKKRRLD